MPFVLPTVVVGVAFRTLLAPSGALGSLRLDGTPVAIVAAMVFFNLAVVVRTVGGMWEHLDPRREQAAAALGASPWQVLRTVTLPALAPALVAAASIVFLFCATAFGIVLTLGGLHYSTVETEIYLLTTQFLDLQAAAALSVLQLVVVTVLLYAAHASRTRREHAVDRSAARAVVRAPRRGDLPVLARDRRSRLALVAVPLLTLVLGSLRVDGGWGLGHYRALGSDDRGHRAARPGHRGADELLAGRRRRDDARDAARLPGGLRGVADRRAPGPSDAAWPSSTRSSCCRSASPR